jgi:hypothetical protein
MRSHRAPQARYVLACPECGGRMRLIAFIAEPSVAKQILDHLRLDSTLHR